MGRVIKPEPGGPLGLRYGGWTYTTTILGGTVYVSDVPARRAGDPDTVSAAGCKLWTDAEWWEFAERAVAWRREQRENARQQ